MNKEKIIKENIEIHDKVAKKYDNIHGEIFSNIEQKRILKKLDFSKSKIKSKSLKAFDLGCGSGNLSNHLFKLGFKVTCADVSSEFLKLVSKRFSKYDKDLSLFKLNGNDLKEIKNSSFDFVGTYSVLHHIPDYLKSIEEMYRVLKKGGILYLDHEVNSNYWNPSKDLIEFRNKNRVNVIISNWRNYFNFNFFLTKFKQIKNPKFRPEGDIHVFKDDHIDWDKIQNLIKKLGGKILLEEDYLLYKKGYDKRLFKKFKNKCSDYKVLIIQK